MSDTSLLKNPDASPQLFRLLVANVADYAIFMLDPSGHIATWNPGAARIKGYTADEIIGRHFSVFYPAEDVQAGKCELELDVAARVGRFEDEDWRIRKDGSRFWANVVITAIRDRGELVGFAKITRDLTERKRAEDERAARLAAEQANRVKDDFLATLGHELRNPLAPIVTALQLGKLHTDRYPARELDVIERQIGHLTQLVDELLDVARISRGKLELEQRTLDVREPLAKAIEIADPVIQQRRHALDVDVPPRPLLVHGDPKRLTQMFANLVVNAAKYTPPGGHVRVAVAQRGDRVAVEVHDDGLGIDAPLLPSVFDPFVQGTEHRAQSGGGLGLGLSLVRAIALLHGGRVDARSPGIGAGSTFTVELPALAGATAHAVAAEVAAPAPTLTARSRRILIVDDNDDARTLLADLLAHLGHDVQVAGDGVAALEIIRDFAPDLAILDIGLPGMDGYALAAALRTAHADIHLIALTGFGRPEDRARTLAAGFDQHLAKPAGLRQLREAIDAVATR